jgi:hypothetical protein
MKPRCSICGSQNSLDGVLCQHLCFWIVEEWVGWNARMNEVKFFNQLGLELWSMHRQSYPKMVRTARSMGWTGRENVVGTFPHPVIVMPTPHRPRRAA